MSYLNNCKKYKDKIINNFSNAECIENVFEQKTLDKIIEYQFQNTYKVKWTDTSKNIQPLCDIDNLFIKVPELQSIFQDIIGNFSKKHTGKY